MAFGITREQLEAWKLAVREGHIALLTHYWQDPRFPQYKTVTKVGSSSIQNLIIWGEHYGLKQEWLHLRNDYPHFDLLGHYEKKVLQQEGLDEFRLGVHILRYHK